VQEGGKRTTGRLRCGPELGLVRALAARTCGASASTLNSLAKPVLSSSMLRVPSPSVSSVLNTCRTRPGGMPWLAAVWGVASATLSPANAAAATSVMVPVCAGKRRQPRSPRNVPRSVQRSLGENFRTECRQDTLSQLRSSEKAATVAAKCAAIGAEKFGGKLSDFRDASNCESCSVVTPNNLILSYLRPGALQRLSKGPAPRAHRPWPTRHLTRAWPDGGSKS
jgi:hypothetical protein